MPEADLKAHRPDLADTTQVVPAGFQLLDLPTKEGFIGHNGPLYARRSPGGVVFGARIGVNHCNPMQICHGGWLATLMDMVLPLGARAAEAPAHFLLTVSLNLDYLAPVKLGSWVEGEARVLRRTARMVFVDGLLQVEGSPVVRGSGVFRIGPPAPVIPY